MKFTMEFPAVPAAIPGTSLSPPASSAGPDHFPNPAGGGGLACHVRELGCMDYQPVWQAMQDYTAARTAQTADELWIVEHPPVYTVGLAGREAHYPKSATGIPVVRIDRGGQITYHGPGQVVVYALVDLVRRGIKVREMVCLLEQAAIDELASHGITGLRRAGAPGVYVDGAKIAALGLKVKRQGCYHGISLNVDMDLAPFDAIDPCGYPGLQVTSLAQLGVAARPDAVALSLARRIAAALAGAPATRTGATCTDGALPSPLTPAV
jgi:lipoyl(octanoyl) transferase